MVKDEFTVPSRDKKTALHTAEQLPEGSPRAVLQISHGVSEYILHYGGFAEFLTARGFAVVGNDHLGPGCISVRRAAGTRRWTTFTRLAAWRAGNFTICRISFWDIPWVRFWPGRI